MPVFDYIAIDKHGKEVRGKLEVESHQIALAKVRELGYYPTSVFEEKAKVKKPVEGKVAEEVKAPIRLPITILAGSIGQKQLTLFTRQLATLIGAGLPLVRSLYVLDRQERGGVLKATIRGLAEQVEGGTSFSDALSKFPRNFSPLYINTIKAGETGGVLEVVLSRLAEFLEKTERLKMRIKSALIYPALVLSLALSVLTFLITFIVPRFMEIFKEMGIKPPFLTQLLINISDAVRQRWLLGLGVLFGLIMAFKFAYGLPTMRLVFDNIRLRIPIMGPLIRKIAIARFSRTLGTLLASGVPILQGLLVAKDTAGNEVIARSITEVHNSVREGETVAKPLLKIGIFPAMAVNMISVGEETGSLDQMLLKVGDVYDEEVDVTVSGLMSLIEPFLIMGMGLIVGFIVVAMFLPLFSVIKAIGVAQ
ncbi:MAG: type II secretion system F family protein [Candidatus Omnitrophota bacterium]